MTRTALVLGLLLGLVAMPGPARGQASLPTRIGFLPLGSPSSAYDRSLVESFRQGLRDVGLIENRNVVLDVVWIASEPEAAQAADELMRRGARLLVPAGTVASLAAKRHTATVPIMFISVGNPVGIGLVESLSRPGGNATGFSDVLLDLSGKLVQFAKELARPRETIHYLWHTGWADGQRRFQATEVAAQAADVKIRAYGISEIGELGNAMAAMKKAGATKLIVQPSPFTYRQRERIIDAASKQGIATIFAFPPAAREGAIIAYGPDYGDLYRRSAAYVDRILKGTSPADLPVEQPTKFELVINARAAKALGLSLPQSLLVQATEIIQ
jgi:putative ABC transport system substrate-binding protein